jgi:hypothetical protein
MDQTDQTPSPESMEEKAPPAAAPVKSPEKENRFGKFLKSAIRWFFGLLIVFCLGALAAIYALYIPERQGLQTSQADLQTANQKIADLESQVQKMKALESQNVALQKEVDAGVTHIKLLTALGSLGRERRRRGKNSLNQHGIHNKRCRIAGRQRPKRGG